MNHKNVFVYCVCVLNLLVFSACIKTYKLVPPETPQGEEVKDVKTVAESCVRSVKVYDEWETRATFDVLWLSDDARKTANNVYCSRRGKSDGCVARHDHRVTTTFYVLADVRDRLHPDMSDKEAAWTMYLDVDGKQIAPEKDSVKEVELSPELREFFGYRYKSPKFKTAYAVRFPIVVSQTKPFKMYISSPSRRCELGWNGAEPVRISCFAGKAGKIGRCKDGKFFRHEDFYWG